MPDFLYGSGPPIPVPPMSPSQIAEGVTLIRPLSRKGTGPGLIVLTPYKATDSPPEIEDGVPGIRMKWAEEGYCVVEVRQDASSSSIKAAIKALDGCKECEPKEKIGLVCYSTDLWLAAASAIENLRDRIVGAALYASVDEYPRLSSQASVPTIYHLASSSSPPETSPIPAPTGSKIYHYPSTSAIFSTPFTKTFHYASEALSHSRNLSFLKPLQSGPYFDLELLWDEHTYYEFGDRSIENTMATMVAEPYVNHIPTMTGGIGRAALSAFYRDHFIFSNPPGTELELISRTAGIDRVVDEFIFKFKHTQMVDWLFPGVPPTNKDVEIPMMAVVNIRGDRLYHEHISWDQASALRQIGVLPESVKAEVEGKNWEVRLPVAGSETAVKMREKNGVVSNGMFEFVAKEMVNGA